MSLSTLISVNGINLAELFVELYNSAKAFNHDEVEVITRGIAEKILRVQLLFGKFCGKYLEIDFRKTTVNFYYYNRRNGTNAGQAVVKRLMTKSMNRTPVSVLRHLETRKNPAVHVRPNQTTDFIPNANNNSNKTSFIYGNGNTHMMNVIHPPRRGKSVDTSTIHNPATLPANIPEKKKKIQVINPRFNPERYVMTKVDIQNMLADDTLTVDSSDESDILPTTSVSTSTTSNASTSATSATSATSDNMTFDLESAPVQGRRQKTERKVVESHVPIPESMPVLKDEPMQIPKDGVVLDAVEDGVEKDNEPVPVNRFQRANRKKKPVPET